MPSAKDGTAGALIPPTDPETAIDADNAEPGEVEKTKAAERESKTGKYGTEPVKAYTPPTDEEAPAGGGAGSDSPQEQKKKKSWIAIKLIDADGLPVAGEPYKITLPDQSVATGSTDGQGQAKISGFDPGQCKVEFPKLDKTVVDPQ